MRVLVVSPKPKHSRTGNDVTSRRWAGHLRALGHTVRVAGDFPVADDGDGGAFDPELLVALHARRSAPSVERFRRRHPDRPLVVALTGTDLYRDLEQSEEARRSLGLADRLVVLQEKALERLPEDRRERGRVIHQSCDPPPGPPAPREDVFEVAFLCHMRPVKDPFRAPAAARRLPSSSRLLVTHVGRALTPEMEERARAEDGSNDRYDWVGEVSRDEALRLLARSRLLVLTSRLEGGANVVTEALACGTPVVSSRIEGSEGLLGVDYPGYFPVGDTPALTARFHRAEMDPEYYAELDRRCRERAHLADPEREREAWASLLAELEGA